VSFYKIDPKLEKFNIVQDLWCFTGTKDLFLLGALVKVKYIFL